MLKALLDNKEEVLSYELDYNSQVKNHSFRCLDCNQIVSFVNSTFKVKHFRHKIISNCEWEPETIEHVSMKKFIIDNFNLTKENVEVKLGNARADIYLPSERIAIEVQHSRLSYDDFVRRTQYYSLNNIHVLWLFHIKLITKRPSEFLKKAHRLGYGKIYVYLKGKEHASIAPLHFEREGRWVEPNDFSSHIGYYKVYRKIKRLVMGKLLEDYSIKKIENYQEEDNFNYKIASFNDSVFWKVRNG